MRYVGRRESSTRLNCLYLDEGEGLLECLCSCLAKAFDV